MATAITATTTPQKHLRGYLNMIYCVQETSAAYVQEIEMISEAFEELQKQNTRLLQQVAERDEVSNQLVTERIKSGHAAAAHKQEQAAAAAARQRAEQAAALLQERVNDQQAKLQVRRPLQRAACSVIMCSFAAAILLHLLIMSRSLLGLIIFGWRVWHAGCCGTMCRHVFTGPGYNPLILQTDSDNVSPAHIRCEVLFVAS